MNIKKSEKYLKEEKEFLRKHKDLSQKYIKTLEILKENITHPSLRLHKLYGDKNGLYSISINIQYRILLEILILNDTIYLISIGIHNDIY